MFPCFLAAASVEDTLQDEWQSIYRDRAEPDLGKRHFAWNAGVENKDDKDVSKGPIYVKGESIDPGRAWTCDFHALARTLQ